MKEDDNLLYEERKYTEDWQIKRPIKGLIFYMMLLMIPILILLMIFYEIIILKTWSWSVFVLGIISFVGALTGYWTALRIYWAMWRTYNNTIKITPNGIEIGSIFKAQVEDIERSTYDISTGYLYIYLKNGKKFKICKDISKISYFGGGTHFSYEEYGKALKNLEFHLK